VIVEIGSVNDTTGVSCLPSFELIIALLPPGQLGRQGCFFIEVEATQDARPDRRGWVDRKQARTYLQRRWGQAISETDPRRDLACDKLIIKRIIEEGHRVKPDGKRPFMKADPLCVPV
jgi:hypothetical protein